MSLLNLKGFIIKWDNNFPLDYWWRKKYKISFNTPTHREACLIDIGIEYLEGILMEEYHKEKEERKENLEHYKSTGEFLKKVKYEDMTEEEIEEWYDSIDLEELNKNNPVVQKMKEEENARKN